MHIDDVISAARQAKDAGATRFCMGAAWRGPKEKDIGLVENMISEVKKWNGILMQKNTLREFQTNKILERINYYLEKSSPL